MDKQEPTVINLPERIIGETDDAYYKRCTAWIAGEDIRVKTDLKDWTGSPTFHLNKEPK